MIPHRVRASFLAILLIFLDTFHQGECIDCYSCNSGDSNCGEVPNGDQLITDGKVASGCPSCVKEFKFIGTVWSEVKRRCGTNSETSDSCTDILGNGKCVCTTTFCNHGNSIQTRRQNQLTFSCVLVCSFLSSFLLRSCR